MADPAAPRRGGLAEVFAEQFTLQAVIGGKRGLAESILPMSVFSVVWAFTHDVPRSVLAALVPSVVFTLWRLVAREPLTQAVSGLMGIALGAGIALFTGRAQDFFVPGIVKNIGFGAVYAASSLVRWPLIGVLLGFTLGEETRWRHVPERMRVYQIATWLWVGVFGVRALVQGWLYSRGDATALGFVNILLGLPLFGVAVAGTWLVVRRVPVARAADPESADPESAARAAEPAAAPGGDGRRRQRIRADPSPPRTGLSRTCSSSSLSGTVTNISSSFASSVSSRLGAIGRSSRMMQTSTVSGGSCSSPAIDPTTGEPGGSVSSTIVACPCWNVKIRTRSPIETASSTRAVMSRGVDTATSTPQASSNIHSFLGLLTRATVRGTPYSVLASSDTTRLTLSSPLAATTTSQSARPASSRVEISQASASSHCASGTLVTLTAAGSRSTRST